MRPEARGLRALARLHANPVIEFIDLLVEMPVQRLQFRAAIARMRGQAQ